MRRKVHLPVENMSKEEVGVVVFAIYSLAEAVVRTVLLRTGETCCRIAGLGEHLSSQGLFRVL